MSRLEHGARVIELGVASAVTLLILALHANVLVYAGPLWRDEISSLSLATKPTLHEFWSALTFDPVPALFFAILRFWQFAGLGATDNGLRVLGFLIGVATVLVLWVTTWSLKKSPPTWALLLFGLSPVAFIWGDSLRAYGLSCVCNILAIGLIWKLVSARPRPWHVALAFVAALCSVQALFPNALLLFAAGSSAILIALWRRWYVSAVLIAGIGLSAALSLLPYWPTIQRTQDWSMICRTGIDVPRILTMTFRAMSVSGQLGAYIWIALTVLLMVASLVALFRPALFKIQDSDRNLVLYLAGTFLVSFAAIIFFFRMVGWTTSIWYYLPLMGSAAVCLDGMFKILPERAWLRGANALLLLGAAGTMTPLAIHASHMRLTNMDLTARVIAQRAQPDDLVVVDNFFYSVSFQRYYHGAAPCLPVPAIADLSLHRWDLLKGCMMQPSPTKSILARIDQTLQSGHTVYVVGFAAKNNADSLPSDLAPAPSLPSRWAASPYLIRWTMQVAYVVQTHATHGHLLEVPCDQPVSEAENVHAISVNGWKPPTVVAQ